jgi:nucleotide-binding universal stress UspA family protein
MVMGDLPRRPRKVFVLGRDATLDVESTARRVIADKAELVLLSMGHPVAPAQQAVIGDAMRLADQLRLWVDAALVSSSQQLAELVQRSDDVTVLASGGERREIERALGGKARRVRAVSPVAVRARPRPVAIKRAATADTASMEEAAPGITASESVEALAGREVVQSVLDTVWTKGDAEARKRASLRVYLGAAPGVGKTYAMLGEGQRRMARGTDVVVGVVQTYDRPKTIEMLNGLETIPPRKIEYRGAVFEEMDAEGIIDRRPEVALIDELAHTNVPGSRRAKRWEDVIDVLSEGITVITTLNVQHLASVNDVVAAVTGIRQQETVPDWILDLADDVELVDISPHALQRRMIHGNVYPDPRKAELALRRFFTTENLTALRELALMRVANKVDDALLARWSQARAPETRERVLVCISRPDISEDLVRRGCRIAQRTGGDLLVVHVVTGDSGPDQELLEEIQRLVEDTGGEFQTLQSDDPVEAVLSFAYQQGVTQILVGESVRARWRELLRGSFVNRLIQKANNVDIHVIARRER